MTEALRVVREDYATLEAWIVHEAYGRSIKARGRAEGDLIVFEED